MCTLSISCSCLEEQPFSKTAQVHDHSFKGTVKAEKVEKTGKFRITIKNSISTETDRIYTPYKIFAMETGDVNHDGNTDICIGIIKPTPFDPVMKKRLFIFQIDRNYIRPLWLSSRLVMPLVKFTLGKDINGRQIIRTIEQQNAKMYCINEYRWESFGMSFVAKNEDSLSYPEADFLLNSKP